MTRTRVAAVGAAQSFRGLVVQALGGAPDDVEWLPSVASAQRAIGEDGEQIDVVVLGPSVREEEAVALAELTTRQAPTTAVIVVRDEPVDGAFPRLVRSGVRDVVDLSKGNGEFREVLTRAIEWSSGIRGIAADEAASRSKGVIVSVFSTKGGTGKTFLACNLAAALAERSGARVALVDLDHDLGDVFAYFGTNPSRTLHELLALDEGANEEAVAQLGTPLLDNVTGFGSPPDPQAEPLPSTAISRMLRTLREAFPYTVVDATCDYSDHVLATLDVSDAICLVSGLDAIGVRHLSIARQTLERLGIPKERLRVVLNRANSKVDLAPEDVERLLGLRVDARIPSSALVPRSVNRAKLLWVEERRSDVAKGIEMLADGLRADLRQEDVASAVNGSTNGSSNGGKLRRWRKG